MNYEIITTEGTLSAPSGQHIIIRYDDGSFETFPVDESNPRYLRFLEETA